MKINYSSTLKTVSILFFSILLLSSCVTKKKFVAMEDSRNKANQRIKELTLNIEGFENDFNSYKNDFHYNNAFKDNYIDSLNKTIVKLNTDLLSKSDNIDDQVFSFQVEKRRLNELLSDKDKEIRTMKMQLSSLEIQLKDIEKASQDVAIQNRNSLSELNSIKSQLSKVENEKGETNSILSKKISEITQLKTTIASKDSEIEALKNQINLLKSQLKQN